MVESKGLTPGDLKNLFDISRAEVKGKALEQLRQNYYIEAQMRGSDDKTIGGLNINQSGRKDAAFVAKKKEKQVMDDLILLSMLEAKLVELEKGLIEKYGEDFAEAFAAAYLDEETYNRLISIEDQDERRLAIAEAINEGIRHGAIDPNEISQNPDFKDWLDTHAELSKQEYKKETALSRDAELSLNADGSASFDEDQSQEQAFDNLFSPITS